MVFFYMSVPQLLGSRQATIKEIRELVIHKSLAQGKQIQLDRSKFKIANLDTLMFCNDKVLKLENNSESFLKKIDKQYCQLEGIPSHQWYVRGLNDVQHPVKQFYSKFVWNKAKFQYSLTIPALVESMEVKLNGIQSDLRKMTTTFNDQRTSLNQNTQKQGNYNVKDLNDVIVEPYVSTKDFIHKQFITTVVCIVPVVLIEEFQRGYETVTENVIPYSAKKLKIPEKDGLTLWTVNLFAVKLQQDEPQHQDHHPDHKHKKEKRYATPVAEFIDKARDKLKITVRQFKLEIGLNQNKIKKRAELQKKVNNTKKTLTDICLTYFSQVYELYIHVKMLRLVIQSMMRFGSEKTVIYSIEPFPGKQKRVQDVLVEIFGDKEAQGLYGTKDQIEDGEDFFPFVYVPGITF